jgi:hypothetical protein
MMPETLTERNPAELDDLRNAYKAGTLNLYLGAGVSIDSGLPTWRQLVVSMYFRYMNIEQWQSVRPFPNYLYAIGEWYLNKTGESLDIIIRKLKSNLTDDEFLKILYDCLYNQLDENQVRNPFTETQYSNRLLMELTELAAHPNRTLNSIITYNFDDLLEQSFSKKGIDHTPVFDVSTFPRNGTLPVYHPHGFLPFRNGIPSENSTGDIILSEDDYNTIANSSNHWANLIQTSYRTQGTGLMIGLSFSDRNLRRLIDLIANIPLHTNNYIFLKRSSMPEFTEKDSKEIKDKADAIVHKMQQAGVKMATRTFDVSQQILAELFRKDEEITIKVFEEMRIKPIWYSEHKEIHDFVKAIRD